jgi:hypothetical protein
LIAGSLARENNFKLISEVTSVSSWWCPCEGEDVLGGSEL